MLNEAILESIGPFLFYLLNVSAGNHTEVVHADSQADVEMFRQDTVDLDNKDY